MSSADQTDKLKIAIFETFPDCYSLKQKLREAEGMETWDVFDRPRKKKLVLKRIKKGSAGDDPVFERFKNDFFTLESLRQNGVEWPAIVAVGKDDNGIWSLREPFVGKSLAETVSQGKFLREHDAARRFLALTDLLISLHGGNLLHRNLKPTNIFCQGVDGAVFVDPDAGSFKDPAFWGADYNPLYFGSVDFLAPEQRSPDGTTSDVRADLWSLTASLAFALTGKTPAELQPEAIPEAFKPLIFATMKDDPSDRTTGLAEFRTELEQIVRSTRPSAFTSTQVETSDPQQPPQSTPAPKQSPTPDPVKPQPTAAPEQSPTPDTVKPQPTPAPEQSPTPDPVKPQPTAAPEQSPTPDPVKPQPAAAPTAEAMPQGVACPQCHTPVRSAADKLCSQCGRVFLEPCLNCQSMNPFWLRHCRGCGSDLLALKQKMLANLNGQKQQILKLRETYGHDKTLPLLKYMSTVNHPDFVAFKEWAKSMAALIHKERRDIKAYVDNVRGQANAAMEAQKYDKVQQILEQVPRPLLDEPMRKQYVEAGEALTEVDSLIREIRNAISTKQYSQLLSCVQRYLELKANDPEARNLQQKIEKLTTITSSKGMKLRRIPSGRFYMGSHDTDEFLRNNEHPQHRVQITRSLFVGVYPVTQSDFLQIMDFNPSVSTENENSPADSVTWFSAVEFCNKMSELEELSPFYELRKIKRRGNGAIENADVSILGGDGYRLLSEAEWEYVCRAGSITPWCFGDQVMEVGEYAWYFDNAYQETHPVGEKKPNSWGLFDMHGNVMEWCHDWYGEFYYQQCQEEEENPFGPDGGTTKVLRGGAWQFGAEATRSAYRNSSSPDTASSIIGFRVCRNATDDAI